MTRSIRLQLIGNFTIYLSLFVSGLGYCTEVPPYPQSDEVTSAIHRSASYLVKATQKDGRFKYRINMNPTVSVKNKYNILRHAGTIYALCQYYQNYPDENVRKAIIRSGNYLLNHCILPIPGQKNMTAIWSKPEINGTGNPLQAKLGGTGLGLIALVSIDNLFPGFISLGDLRALGRFITYMQQEDGSFHAKYIPSKGGRQNQWESLYYPGEAALGLLMLYKKNPSGIWLHSAYQALRYLALKRRHGTEIPADHWALLATEKLLSLGNIVELPTSRGLLTHHAIQICESILNDQVTNLERPEYHGGFSADGRTTPTATRLEGLIASASIVSSNHGIGDRLNYSIPLGISFLLRAQIKTGVFAGAMPRATMLRDGVGSDIEKFNRRATEVRIDYIQHSLSAMIQYLQLTK